MGYFNDFFKALFVKLGQKYADNYGSATNTVVPLLNQSDMSPKGAMSVQDFALALGVKEFVFITSNTDLNDYTDPSKTYICASGTTTATLSNSPITNTGFKMLCFSVNAQDTPNAGRLFYLLFANNNDGKIFYRKKLGSTFTNWYVFQGTEIVPTT